MKVNEIYHQMTRSINQPWTTSSAKGNYSNFLKGLACSLYFHLLVRLLQVCTSKNHKGFNKCKHKGVESTSYHALPLGLLAHLLYYDIVYQTCQKQFCANRLLLVAHFTLGFTVSPLAARETWHLLPTTTKYLTGLVYYYSTMFKKNRK